MDFLGKRSPFQVILMGVFAFLALAGILAFATVSSSGGASKIGTVTIWGTLPEAAVTKELNAISSTNKAYGKVTYVEQPAATFDSDLANAIASGNGPDLIIISQEQLITEEGRLNVIPFSAIPQRTFVQTYLPEDQLYLTSTGTYGIPYVLDPLVLYYNQTLLSQAGVAVAPSSWEAVTGLAPTLTHLSNHVPVQSAVALGTYANIQNARAILSTLFFQAGSTITSTSETGVGSTLARAQAAATTGVSPIAAALNFYTQFADPSRTVYSWNANFSSDYQQFLAGDLALYLGLASEQPLISAANPNLSYQMAPLPQLQTAAVKSDYGLAYAFAIPKASQNPSGALSAAEILASPTYLPIAAQGLSMAPANRTLLTPSATDLYAPVYYPAALIASGWLSPAPATTDQIFSAMITSVSSGASTASAAVNAVDQALDAALPTSQ
jgi:ABC-type glycerol-3-phosphate transport system substrate-binding protein